MASVSPRAAFRALNVLAIGTVAGGVLPLARGGDRDPVLIVSPASLELAPQSDGSESWGSFQIINAGGRAAQLGQASTTCVCTVVEIEPQTIPPGGTATVSIQARPVGVGRTRVSIVIPTDANPAELSLNVDVVGRTVPPHWLLDPASTIAGIQIEGGFVAEGSLSDGLCWRRHDYTARLNDLPSPGEFQGELLFAGRDAGEEPVLRLPVHGIHAPAGTGAGR